MHAFNDNHNLIRRQEKHGALYSKPRIQLMEEFIYKHLLLLPQSNTQNINVLNTQTEARGNVKHTKQIRSFEHLCNINKLLCWPL